MSAESTARVLGEERRSGHEWKCRCLLCGGRLTLGDSDRGLLAKCWGGCEARDVYAELRRQGYLSGERPAPLSPDEIAIRNAVAERERRRKIAQASDLWNEARPIKDTLADHYLRVARGIDVLSPYISETAAVARYGGQLLDVLEDVECDGPYPWLKTTWVPRDVVTLNLQNPRFFELVEEWSNRTAPQLLRDASLLALFDTLCAITANARATKRVTGYLPAITILCSPATRVNPWKHLDILHAADLSRRRLPIDFDKSRIGESRGRPAGMPARRSVGRRAQRGTITGRPAYGGRTTCESCNSLDVRRLHREGRLRMGQWFSWKWACGGISVWTEVDSVILTFGWRESGSNEPKSVEQRVPIVWTNCHLGGRRPWFQCTACGRRVAKLYLGGRPVFACRHCYGLAYASQQEGPRDRALTQAQNIRERLGGSVNLLDDPFPEKPRRMHWRTYRRLRQRAEAAELRSNALMLRWLRRPPARAPDRRGDGGSADRDGPDAGLGCVRPLRLGEFAGASGRLAAHFGRAAAGGRCGADTAVSG
jgi:hypothetical protein